MGQRNTSVTLTEDDWSVVTWTLFLAAREIEHKKRRNGEKVILAQIDEYRVANLIWSQRRQSEV